MQRFMSSGRPLESRYRMPTGITLMVSIVENAVISSLAVTDVHQERRDGAKQEERTLCDKDNGPRRAHGKNHRRCNGDNKQQLGQHDRATIVHHKHHRHRQRSRH